MASIDPHKFLSHLPAGLTEELLACYRNIVQNYVESRWEPAELNGGKFCEVVYTILDGAISGAFSAKASKPANMMDACRALESRPADSTRVGDRSLRILIPRLLPYLYEIRNNRGVGHVGGDVNPNQADSEAVLAAATWIMAELGRIFHGTTLSEAQIAVDLLVQRRHPLVWTNGSIKRVLDPSMKKADQTLLLLYSESSWVSTTDLCNWVEYSVSSMFKKRVLEPLHKQRLIEYDAKKNQSMLTSLGIRAVENGLLPK